MTKVHDHKSDVLFACLFCLVATVWRIKLFKRKKEKYEFIMKMSKETITNYDN